MNDLLNQRVLLCFCYRHQSEEVFAFIDIRRSHNKWIFLYYALPALRMNYKSSLLAAANKSMYFVA